MVNNKLAFKIIIKTAEKKARVSSVEKISTNSGRQALCSKTHCVSIAFWDYREHNSRLEGIGSIASKL